MHTEGVATFSQTKQERVKKLQKWKWMFYVQSDFRSYPQILQWHEFISYCYMFLLTNNTTKCLMHTCRSPEDIAYISSSFWNYSVKLSLFDYLS